MNGDKNVALSENHTS